jgi:hypothetical protein
VTGAPGTLERLALALGAALAPLEEELVDGNIESLLNQLGLSVKDLAVPAALSGALAGAAAAAASLPAEIAGLTHAIEDEDLAQIVNHGASTLNAAKAVLTAIDAIPSQLGPALTAAGAHDAAFLASLPRRLLDFALIRYFEDEHPLALAALGLAGVVERARKAKANDANLTYLARNIRYDLIGAAISSPDTVFQSLYQWGQPGFDGIELLRRIAALLDALGATVGFRETPAPLVELFGFSVGVTGGAPPRGLVATLADSIPGGWSLQFDLTPTTRLEASLSGSLAAGVGITLRPPAALSMQSAASAQGQARIGVVQSAPPGQLLTLLGIAGGIGIRAQSLGIHAGADFAWSAGTATGELALGGDLRGGKFTIDFSGADGFVGTILSVVKLDADFDLGFDWSVDRGLRFRGSSTVSIKLPAHIALGPVAINGLTLSVRIENDRFPIGFAADIGAHLGVLDVVVEEIGVDAILSFPPGGGNIGPVQLNFGFHPPKGAGLTVDAGVIKGGGYLRFDPAAGEYVGALELSFQGIIDLKAFGIINTKFPDGRKGFAFLILVTAEFAPIQLGFGFTLLGVGGLLSLNRTLDVPALMTGVRTGSVNSLLFPKDVVANIGRIASDIKTLFPLAEGHFIVAPMGKLGWGTPTLITVEIGVILDIPEPQLVIVGVVRVALPTVEAPLILLQVNFAGGIDFDQGLLWFNASLFDSRLVAFTLAGDMALRIGWGARPMLVMSAGGFHPAFREVPDDLRGMRRMSISLLSGDNPRITVETYFAITSNTVQSGARVELYAAACGFNIYGFLGYDLLVQFKPLHFVADLSAGLALRKGTSVIAGISLHGQLSGPAPWNARGTATFEFLFFDISVSFDETWGDSASPDPVEIEQVDKMMRDAIADDRNWRAVVPANATAVQPFAVLSVSQKVAPLEFDLEKFGNKKPDVARFTMTTSLAGTDKQREEFAVANFRKMSDSEKLSAPSFERMISGLSFSTGDAIETGARVQAEVDYELSYVYRSIGLVIFVGAYRLYDLAFGIMAGAWSAVGNAFSPVRNQLGATAAVLEIKADSFHVVGVDDLAPAAGAASVGSMAEALSQRDALIAADPALRNRLQVVASHELDLAA